jgi:hypothetical protein
VPAAKAVAAMSPFDLIRSSRDGSLSPPKLFATLFHAALFVTVCWVTWLKRDFVESMWLLYAGVAVGHQLADKGAAMIYDTKQRRITAEHPDSAPAPLGSR